MEEDTETPARYKPTAAPALIAEQLWPEKLCVFTVSIVLGHKVTYRLLHVNELWSHCVSLWAIEWGRGPGACVPLLVFHMRAWYGDDVKTEGDSSASEHERRSSHVNLLVQIIVHKKYKSRSLTAFMHNTGHRHSGSSEEMSEFFFFGELSYLNVSTDLNQGEDSGILFYIGN